MITSAWRRASELFGRKNAICAFVKSDITSDVAEGFTVSEIHARPTWGGEHCNLYVKEVPVSEGNIVSYDGADFKVPTPKEFYVGTCTYEQAQRLESELSLRAVVSGNDFSSRRAVYIKIVSDLLRDNPTREDRADVLEKIAPAGPGG